MIKLRYRNCVATATCRYSLMKLGVLLAVLNILGSQSTNAFNVTLVIELIWFSSMSTITMKMESRPEKQRTQHDPQHDCLRHFKCKYPLFPKPRLKIQVKKSKWKPGNYDWLLFICISCLKVQGKQVEWRAKNQDYLFSYLFSGEYNTYQCPVLYTAVVKTVLPQLLNHRQKILHASSMSILIL